MYFDNLHALLLMDGHGLYVWLSYAVAGLVLGAFILQTQFKKQQFFKTRKRLRDDAAALKRIKMNH